MSKVPIWAVAAPGARKPRFSREQIATAALKIADAEGIEALSMRRVAEALGAGTMTLYYYVRTKEDLLALVEDALMGEIADACERLPVGWRPALAKLAAATRTTCLRHAWALRSASDMQIGRNALRHVEQSLRALASTGLALREKLLILSIVDDFVFGHCAAMTRRDEHPPLDRKATRTLREAINRALDEGDYPEVRAMIGEDDPVDTFMNSSRIMADAERFEIGLEALLSGLAKRFKLK